MHIVRCIDCIRSHDTDYASQIDTCDRHHIGDFHFIFHKQQPPMANYARCGLALVIMLGIARGQAFGALENADGNVLDLNFPYGRGLDSELQVARLLLVTPRFCHPKRNSELINSLLGLPKNMHNAGK